MARDYYFDNAKAILIILVVVGHIIELWIDKISFLRSVWVFIYVFHMPVFAFISGYFSKRLDVLSRKEIKYLILFIAATVCYWPLSHYGLIHNLITPYYALWFMVSLACWSVMLQFFVKFKHPIIASFLIAIVAGYIGFIGPLLSMSRTITFFPFFLLGYYASKEQCQLFKPKSATLVSALAFAIILLLGSSINYAWLWGAFPYEYFGWNQWYAGAFRIMQYSIALLIGSCFLSIIPQAKHNYTWIGSKTLYIYFCHGWLILACIRFI